MLRKQLPAGVVSTGAALAAACVLAVGAASASHTAHATVTVRGKRFAFTGGRCLRAVHGFEVRIGRVGGRYFLLEYILSRTSGTYRNGGILTFVVGRKGYISRQLTLTIRNSARNGTFSGTLRSGASFRGAFHC